MSTDLAQQQLPRLADVAPLYGFRAGQSLGRQGERVERLYVIATGRVLLSRRGPDGEDLAECLLGPGDLLGEGALLPSGTWQDGARALTPGTMYGLSAAELPRIVRLYPAMGSYLLGLLSRRVAMSHERADLLCRPTARERVLGLLQRMADASDRVTRDYARVPVPLTHSQIGGMLGITRETVARVIAGLEREGALRREGRRTFWLAKQYLTPLLAFWLCLYGATGYSSIGRGSASMVPLRTLCREHRGRERRILAEEVAGLTGAAAV